MRQQHSQNMWSWPRDRLDRDADVVQI